MKTFLTKTLKGMKLPFQFPHPKAASPLSKFSSLIRPRSSKHRFLLPLILTTGALTFGSYLHRRKLAHSKSLASMPYDFKYEDLKPEEKYASTMVEYDEYGDRTPKAYGTPEDRLGAAAFDIFLFCGLPFTIARFFTFDIDTPWLRTAIKGGFAFLGMVVYTMCDFMLPSLRSPGKWLYQLINVDFDSNLRCSSWQLAVKTLIDNCGWSILFLISVIEEFPRAVVTLGGPIAVINALSVFTMILDIHSRTLGDIAAGTCVVYDSRDYWQHHYYNGYDIIREKRRWDPMKGVVILNEEAIEMSDDGLFYPE